MTTTTDSRRSATRYMETDRRALELLAKANDGRTQTAVTEWVPMLTRLLDVPGVADLPAHWVEVARLRVRHPGLNYAELAQLCRPEITKDAFVWRLRAFRRYGLAIEQGERIHIRLGQANGRLSADDLQRLRELVGL